MKTACPEDEVIADYLEGRLSDKERFVTEQHFSSCSSCLERLVVTSSVLKKGQEDEAHPVPDEVTKRAVDAVLGRSAEREKRPMQVVHEKLELLSAKVTEVFSFRPWAEQVLQPIRGAERRVEESRIVIPKKIGDLHVEIEITKKAGDLCDIRIAASPADQPLRRLRATLQRDERDIASELVLHEAVVFEEIPLGRYRLYLYHKDVSLGHYAFEITESGCVEQ
jgi:hypothetical protein